MPATEVDSSLPGTSLCVGDVLAGKYRLDALVGEGGTGIVVRATHLALERAVAIKFLRTALADEEIRLRFEREAHAIENIESQHVVAVLDVGTLPDGLPYMVMEFLEGRDLARVLREDGPLAVDEAVGCILQVCEALGAAHALGIIHRDLKPANLFLTRVNGGAPHVKVVDFGISKISDPDVLRDPGRGSTPTFNDVTNATAVLGSPRYMAPEQLRASKFVDARADLWSVGAVLFQLLAGRHPFEAESNVAASIKVLTTEPEDLCSVAPHVPPVLDGIVRKCLMKEVEARWQSADELAEALRPFASERVVTSLERLRAAKDATTVDLVDLGLAPTTVRLPPPAPPSAPAPLALAAPAAEEPASAPPLVAPNAARSPPPRLPVALGAALLVAGMLASLGGFAALRARSLRFEVRGPAARSAVSAAPRREAPLDAGVARP